MSDYNLGTVRGRVEIDASGAEQGVERADRALGKLDTGMGKFGRSAGGLAAASGSIAAAGGAIAGGFALAVNSAIGYEKRLSAIKAVSGATEEEMVGLSETALRIGKETVFSADEAALAIEELVKAGIPIADVMNGAADATVALAAAGEIALPEAATIASNAMNQFGLDAKAMPGVADAIAGAANASAIDVGEFGFALSQAGAVANLTGFKFDDLAVAIAEMGNAGIKGSDAGTSLKTFMQNLIPDTSKQIGLFEELGLVSVRAGADMSKLAEKGIKPVSNNYDDVLDALEKYVVASGQANKGSSEAKRKAMLLGGELGVLSNNFFDAQGNVKSMAEVQGELQRATGDLTKEQRLQTLGTLFGSDAIRAAAVLAENGQEGYDKMAESMGKVTAESVAQERLNNLAGMWEALKGSLETIAIQIGQMLLPALKAVIEFVQMLIEKWNALSPKTQKIIIIVAAVVAGILLLIGVILAVAAAIAGFVAVFALAGSVALPIIGIVAAVVAAIAVIITLAILIYKNWDKIKALTFRVWNAIKNFFVNLWNDIYNGVASFFGDIRDFFVAMWADLSARFAAGGAAVAALWNGTWAFFGNIVSTIFNGIRTFVLTTFNAITGFFRTFAAITMVIWNGFWNGPFGQLVIAIFRLIFATVRYVLSAIVVFIQYSVNRIKAFWTMVWNGIVAFWTNVWNRIYNFLRPIVLRIYNTIVGIFNRLKAQFNQVFNFYKNLVIAIWNEIVRRSRDAWTSFYNLVSGPLLRAKNYITTQLTAAKNTVTGIWNSIVNSTRDAWNRASNVVREKIDSIMNRVRGLKDRIMNAFRDANQWIYNAGRDLIQGLIDGVVSMITSLTDKLNFITDLIPESKGPPKRDKELLTAAGEDIMGGLIGGLLSQVGLLQSTLNGVTNAVPGMVNPGAGMSRSTGFAQGAVSGPTYSKNVYQDVKNYNPVAKPESKQIDEDLQMAAALLEV